MEERGCARARTYSSSGAGRSPGTSRAAASRSPPGSRVRRIAPPTSSSFRRRYSRGCWEAVTRVEQEREYIPYPEQLQAVARGSRLGVTPTEIESGRDRSEHAGDAKLFGRNVCGVGREKRDGNLHERVPDPAPHVRDHPPYNEPYRRPTDPVEHELEPRFGQ